MTFSLSSLKSTDLGLKFKNLSPKSMLLLRVIDVEVSFKG